jgi:hypothetical protein
MQISNIISSFTDTLSLSKKADTVAQTVQKTGAAPDAVSTASNSRKALAAVLKKYDVTQITPEVFSRMLKELAQTGALSDKELQELSAVRLDLENAHIESDETVNLVEFYNNKIRDTQKESDFSSSSTSQQQLLAPLVSRLGWMEKFQTIHCHPEAVGMDLAA